MKHKTSPTGKPADYYVIGLILGGLAFWLLTKQAASFAALFQLVSLCMFAAALFILIRYRLTVFHLRIEGKDGAAVDVHTAMPEELDLVIEEKRGKRYVTLARLSLVDLKRAEVVKYSKLRETVKTKGASVFKYQADMSPEEGCLLIFDHRGDTVAIFTDLSSEMLGFLKKVADANTNY
ncbi:MAG: hypothetical protein IJ386_00850 [Clostridia bacterium]|nr:hypothetical protein [Clostridia bacterium]